MYELEYLRPDSLPMAIALLQEHENARPLSGGMTLLPALKQRLAAPSHLVDLARLPELKGITLAGGVLRIGAATSHAEVARSPQVAQAIPALAKLAGLIADPQVRNRGTIGGSVANNDPAADYPSAVLGLDASVVTSQRRIAAGDFFTGMFETALAPGEVVTAVEFPCPEQAGYLKFRHPASGYAMAGVFVARFGGRARVAVTGAAPLVFRWLAAEERLCARFDAEAIADLRLDPSGLLEDVHAPRRFRAHLAEVGTRRAVASLTPESERKQGAS